MIIKQTKQRSSQNERSLLVQLERKISFTVSFFLKMIVFILYLMTFSADFQNRRSYRAVFSESRFVSEKMKFDIDTTIEIFV
jgi:hypothetical protein